MKWNLKLLYKDIDDPQIKKDIQASEEAINKFVHRWKKNEKYLVDSKVLREALDEYEYLNSEHGILTKPYYFTLLSKELDLNNKELKARLNKLSNKATKLGNELQFFGIKLSKISKKKQDEFVNSKELKEYKHYLEMLFANAKYILSDNEEKVFSLTAKPSFSNWVNMIEELLSKQILNVLDEELNSKKISYNEASKYLTSVKKEVRNKAAEEFNRINKEYIEIAEYEMNSILESKQVSDEYRGMERADLGRHLSTDMDSEVVDSLVGVVTENFDISKEYYKKKAKLLEQETIGYHERNVPISKIDKEYEFEEGLDIVKDVFYSIDKEFGDILTSFIDNGQVDAFPKANKSGGAYCIHINRNLPTYILLNYNSKVNDVLTIAHESGHGIHSELVSKQNALNDDYSLALAEVASTFFEDFTLEEIIKRTDDKELIESLRFESMNDSVNTIFRQVAFYNFEKELHSKFREKGYLSHEEISDIFVKHMTAYLGDAVDVDDGMRYGWIYVSHFRRFFYVYTYASGLLISKYLQSEVRENREFVEKFKDFLKAGSSKSPKDIFMDMGVDITDREFWEKGVKSI
ncbi:MAG: Oligoendopeptidase F [candidate division WS6 bacterium 34_10]|uniref:Oligoendopeptidase F n=1 Tax=candidate division WS6 bacterium 34_10 TaxID=1641389 RepID=A0A101HI86_9BACT|nr:MAG: Oligoendopeptidase F [candidate division WS6 bacterium 34_10]